MRMRLLLRCSVLFYMLMVVAGLKTMFVQASAVLVVSFNQSLGHTTKKSLYVCKCDYKYRSWRFHEWKKNIVQVLLYWFKFCFLYSPLCLQKFVTTTPRRLKLESWYFAGRSPLYSRYEILIIDLIDQSTWPSAKKIDFWTILVICEVTIWRILVAWHVISNKYLSLPKLRRHRLRILGSTGK